MKYEDVTSNVLKRNISRKILVIEVFDLVDFEEGHTDKLCYSTMTRKWVLTIKNYKQGTFSGRRQMGTARFNDK